MTIIKYKRKRLIFNLSIGLAWLILGLVGMFSDEVKWNNYASLSIGVIYILVYLYEQKKQYITFTVDTIKENVLFGKTILKKDINKISFFAGEIKIKTKNNKELNIAKQLIDEGSLIKLNSEIEKLKESLN